MRDAHPVPTPGDGAALPRARARYLAQAIQLEEGGSSAIIGASVYVTALLLVAAIVWAATTEVNEVAVTRGEVVPAGLIHDIQHLEGGIVSEIAVRDGDRVQNGDLLLRFAPPASQSEYAQTLISKTSLELEAERLQAIIERREPDFTALDKLDPDLTRKQLTIYKAQRASHESELRVADAQTRQRHTELLRQQNQAQSIAKEVALLEEQVEMRRQLADNRIVARTDLLATQTRLAEAESKRRTILDGIKVARSAWEGARQHRLELEAQFNKEIELEAGKIASRLAEVEQALVRLKDRVTRLDIYAPVPGIIQGLSITSINAVVKPGQVIMQIVPVEDEMIVETRISPQDIGYVHAGMAADVRVASYDPARFGSVAGTVRRISASTYLDERHQPYYRAEIELQRAYLGEHPQDLRIIPGMTVQADIRTGNKSILDYLMRPVSRGFDAAFRER